MYAGGGFFRYATDILKDLRVPAGLLVEAFSNCREQHRFLLTLRVIQYAGILFGFTPQRDQHSRVAAII